MNWDICVRGICLDGKIGDKINKKLLDNLDREYRIASVDFTDRYSFNAYLKIDRRKEFEEIIEDSVNELISKPLREDVLIEDVEELLSGLPAAFRVKPIVFKDYSGEVFTLSELYQIRNYIVAWKELAKLIFYFTQIGEGEDFARYLKKNHPAIYSEIYSMKSRLKRTILSEFTEFI
jgi:hypothetical protein